MNMKGQLGVVGWYEKEGYNGARDQMKLKGSIVSQVTSCVTTMRHSERCGQEVQSVPRRSVD